MRAIHFQILLTALITAVLVACGGGGGGDSTTEAQPTAQITNSGQAASALTAPEAERATTSLFLPISTGVIGTPFSASVAIADRLFMPRKSGTTTAFVASDLCTTGMMTVPPPDAMSGTITFTDCEIAGGGFFVNGSIAFSGTSDTSGFSVNLIFNSFSISDSTRELASINGTLSMSFSVSGSVWTSSVTTVNLRMTESGETVLLANYSNSTSTDFDSGETTIDFHYTVTADALGGTLIVTTRASEGGAALVRVPAQPYPYTGTIIIIGANNQRARITINGGLATDSVVIEYALGGDGIYDDGMEVLSWTDFLAQALFVLEPL